MAALADEPADARFRLFRLQGPGCSPCGEQDRPSQRTREHTLKSHDRSPNLESSRGSLAIVSGGSGDTLEGKHPLPVPLHVDHGPASRECLVEGAGQPANGRVPVVGILPFGVRVMDDQSESRAGTGGEETEQFGGATGVYKSADRTPPDVIPQ